MEHHIEEELGFFHPEEGLEEDKMAGTADWQEFRKPLNDSKENSLKEINLTLLTIPSSPLGGEG